MAGAPEMPGAAFNRKSCCVMGSQSSFCANEGRAQTSRSSGRKRRSFKKGPPGADYSTEARRFANGRRSVWRLGAFFSPDAQNGLAAITLLHDGKEVFQLAVLFGRNLCG